MTRRRVTIFATFAGVIGIIGYLFVSGFNESTVAYYRTVNELKTMGVSAEGKSFRVSGRVIPGTVVRAGDGLSATFTITEQEQNLEVSYHGIIPDTFKEGIDVLLEGRYVNGRFEATQIFTKCASKYQSEQEAAPTNTAL
jgi:cytochrome c-type biogenesis protein CcmE